MQLTNEQLIQIEGGGIKWGILATIAGAVSFIFGIIDGYVRPASCNLKVKVWK